MKCQFNILKENDQLINENQVFTILFDGIQLSNDTVIYHVRENHNHKYYLIKEYYPDYDKKIIDQSEERKQSFTPIHFINEENYMNTEYSIMPCQSRGSFLSEIIKNNTLNLNEMLDITLSILDFLDRNPNYIYLDICDHNIYFPYYKEEKPDYREVIYFDSGNRIHLKQNNEYVHLKQFSRNTLFILPEIRYINKSVRVGHEADIYCVGRLLLYLLTGEMFVHNHIDRLLYDQSVTLLTLERCKQINCSKEQKKQLHRILNKALELDPLKRYHNAKEMREDLIKVESSSQIDLNYLIIC